ncbi:hypothetical protein [Parasphingorhabdus sp.]|uniref:hypothetical protein n=1 Tax=Parasphingorhabdus sp. TaxID=2709688 RepID=UPI003C76E4DB
MMPKAFHHILFGTVALALPLAAAPVAAQILSAEERGRINLRENLLKNFRDHLARMETYRLVARCEDREDLILYWEYKLDTPGTKVLLTKGAIDKLYAQLTAQDDKPCPPLGYKPPPRTSVPTRPKPVAQPTPDRGPPPAVMVPSPGGNDPAIDAAADAADKAADTAADAADRVLSGSAATAGQTGKTIPLPKTSKGIEQRVLEVVSDLSSGDTDCCYIHRKESMDELKRLRDHARKRAQAAKAAGKFGTIDPKRAQGTAIGVDNVYQQWKKHFANPKNVPTPRPLPVPLTPDSKSSPGKPNDSTSLNDFPGDSLGGPIVRDRLWIWGNYGQANIPETGIGVQRNGPLGTAPEEFAGTTDGRINSFGGGFAVSIGNLTLGFDYVEGDGDTVFDVPGNAGIDSGIVYGQLSPEGSSGIITPFGMQGQTRVDYTEWSLKASMPFHQSTLGEKSRFVLSGFTRYTHSERDYRQSATYSGTGGSGFVFQFDQTRDQSVNEDIFELGIKGKLVCDWGGGVHPWVGALAGGYYYDSSLNSMEINSNNFSAPGDRNFQVDIRDSRDGFGFHGSVGAGLSFDLAPNISLGVGGAYDYRSDSGAIFNPNSGDQVFFDGLTTELRTSDIWSWRIGAGVRIGF